MNDLLLHPQTSLQLARLLSDKPHALMLSGLEGSGKHTLALWLARQLLGINTLANYPYFLLIAPVKESISIDAVRNIKTFLGKKTAGTRDVRRIILIENAHRMSLEAQNALLKVLEEPPADTMIILTVSDQSTLQPTIVSRVQHVAVLPLTLKNTVASLNKLGYSQQAIVTAYHISGGRAGLLTALLEQKTDHEVANAVQAAKEFIGLSTYQRLLQAESLSKQRAQTELFLAGLQRVSASGLEQSALKNNMPQARKFNKVNNLLQETQIALQSNVSAKLALTNLFLQM